MKSTIAAFALLCAITLPCLGQQGSTVYNGHPYFYNNGAEKQLIDDLIRQRQDIESLRQAADARDYSYRYPTPEEIAAMVKAWNDANPFISSMRMPDFSKQRIRVKKSDALDQKLAEIEMRLQKLENQRLQRP